MKEKKKCQKTVPESNHKFVERDKIDTHSTQIHVIFYIPSLVQALQ